MRGVVDRNHQDRADVVGDREGEQENPQLRRHAPAEQRENGDRESDVRRHRNAPTRRAFATEVQGEIKAGRQIMPPAPPLPAGPPCVYPKGRRR